jgi:hypothetical protein
MECIGVGSITTTTKIILDSNRCTILLVLVIPVITINTLLKRHSSLEGLAWCWRSELVRSRSHFTTDSMSWYRPPLWDLQPDISCRNDVWNLRSCLYWSPTLTRGRVCNLRSESSCYVYLCWCLEADPIQNPGRISRKRCSLLRVCVVMGMLWPSNEHL